MRILVTGSDGFIGAKVCSKLREKGFEVEAHTLAVSDIGTGIPEYKGIDWVLHLAALTSIRDSWDRPGDFYNINFMGTQRVLEVCRKNNCGMTFMSTYVYGHPKYLPVDEAHQAMPNSPYSQTKYLAEQLCGFYSSNYSIPCVILRPFNIYGPGQSGGFLVPSIFAQVMDPSTDEVRVENLRPKRDYVYVDDVVGAIVSTIGRKTAGVYNIGTGVATGVGELIEAVFKVTGIRKKVISVDKIRPDEVHEITASYRKINGDLGWAPATGLEEGLKKTFLESISA